MRPWSRSLTLGGSQRMLRIAPRSQDLSRGLRERRDRRVPQPPLDGDGVEGLARLLDPPYHLHPVLRPDLVLEDPRRGEHAEPARAERLHERAVVELADDVGAKVGRDEPGVERAAEG